MALGKARNHSDSRTRETFVKGGQPNFAPHRGSCPLREQCTSARAGRSVSVHVHEDVLQRAKAAQREEPWKPLPIRPTHRRAQDRTLCPQTLAWPAGANTGTSASGYRRSHEGRSDQLGEVGHSRVALVARWLGDHLISAVHRHENDDSPAHNPPRRARHDMSVVNMAQRHWLENTQPLLRQRPRHPTPITCQAIAFSATGQAMASS